MTTQTTDELLRENEDLRRRLEEAEEALRALRAGEVDAVLIENGREQVYTLETADKPYRLLVAQVPHAAVTLTADGAIIYCNRRFADLLGGRQRSCAAGRSATSSPRTATRRWKPCSRRPDQPRPRTRSPCSASDGTPIRSGLA